MLSISFIGIDSRTKLYHNDNENTNISRISIDIVRDEGRAGTYIHSYIYRTNNCVFQPLHLIDTSWDSPDKSPISISGPKIECFANEGIAMKGAETRFQDDLKHSISLDGCIPVDLSTITL